MQIIKSVIFITLAIFFKPYSIYLVDFIDYFMLQKIKINEFFTQKLLGMSSALNAPD